MTSFFASPAMRSLRARFVRLYGEAGAGACLERLAMLVGRYGVGAARQVRAEKWSQRDALLIAYGDMIRKPGEAPLATLTRFLDSRLAGVFSAVHILPFFPSSSDGGFAVQHYRQVSPELGGWAHIRDLARRFDLMVDLVLNHVSSQSGWFADFQMGIAPAREYFIEVPPDADLSAVVRPRTTPLLTPVQTRAGVKHVWTTFSADQVDLNFARPDVLFEMLDLLLFYASMGARLIRLDAVAFLWKEIGTSCLHRPQTHELVRLFREFLKIASPDTLLLTETNVPQAENLAYFGRGDEAHLVYQFPLPPLVLDAFCGGSAAPLTRWAQALKLPPAGCTYLNFTASHDGIGLRPAEGLLDTAAMERLQARVLRNGGRVSYRRNPDGSQSPYEWNITWRDALRGPASEPAALHLARLLGSQTLPLALQGIPAVYFHALAARPNDHAAFRETGQARWLNRGSWMEADLFGKLEDAGSLTSQLFRELCRRLRLRRRLPAFHPLAAQRVLDLDPRCFAVVRSGPNGNKSLLALHNVSARPLRLATDRLPPPWNSGRAFKNALAPDRPLPARAWHLAPYEAAWVVGADACPPAEPGPAY